MIILLPTKVRHDALVPLIKPYFDEGWATERSDFRRFAQRIADVQAVYTQVYRGANAVGLDPVLAQIFDMCYTSLHWRVWALTDRTYEHHALPRRYTFIRTTDAVIDGYLNWWKSVAGNAAIKERQRAVYKLVRKHPNLKIGKHQLDGKTGVYQA